MEIKHSLVPGDADVALLFDVVKQAAIANYATPAAQEVAIEQVRTAFTSQLCLIIDKAFNIGMHIGMSDANRKDLEMYSS